MDRYALQLGLVLSALLIVGNWSVVNEIILFSWIFLMVLRAVHHLQGSFQDSERADQIRIKWVLLAGIIWVSAVGIALLTAWLTVLGTVGGDFFYDVQRNLVAFVLLVGTSILVLGMLARGSVDPGLAIRRGLFLSAITLLLVSLFAAVEAAFSDFVFSRIGLPPGASVWIAAGIVAGMSHPLAKRLRPWLDARLARWELVNTTQGTARSD
jgi:hypothetical protein